MTVEEPSSGAAGGDASDRVVRSPRQRAILSLFAALDRPVSTSELAAITSESLGATAHHVRNLAARDFLEQASERRVRGALQTFYVLSPAGEQARRHSCATALAELYGPVFDAGGTPLRLHLDAEAVDELVDNVEELWPRYAEVVRRAAQRQGERRAAPSARAE